MNTKLRSIYVLVLPLVTIFMVDPLWAQVRTIIPRPIPRPLGPLELPPELRPERGHIPCFDIPINPEVRDYQLKGEQASTPDSNLPFAVTLIICSILILIAIVAAKSGGTPSAASVTGKTIVITPSSESSQAETLPPEMVFVVDSKGVANRPKKLQ